MATIIDSLVVKLGLDSSDFDKGRSKVDKTLDDTDKRVEKARNNIGKFLAAIGSVVAIKTFVSNTIDANAALDRLSKNLDENVESVSAWSNAAEQAGGSAEGLQGSLDMLSRSQTELQLTGQSGLIPYFSALGLSMTDVNGKALKTTDMLLNIGQALQSKSADRATQFNMGRMMGIDPGTLNLILRSRAEVEMTLKRQKEQTVVTKKQAEEASRLQRAIVENKQGFHAFGRELLSTVAPALEMVLSAFVRLGEWVRENQEFVKTFLSILAAGLIAVGAAVTPINLTAVAVLALAAAIATLYQDYQTWKRGGDSLIDWGKWEPGITAAKAGLKGIKDLLVDMMIRAIAVGDALLSLSTGDWQGAKTAAKAALFGIPGEGLQAPEQSSPQGTQGRSDRSKFVSEAAARLGVPEAVIDAHLRSETGKTGASTVGAFNYGNIKTGSRWTGQSATRNVLEYDKAGNPMTERSSFRSYGTPEAAGADYARFIARKFPGALGASNASDYAQALKNGGYATDPNYVSKIAGIARGIPGATGAATGAGAGRVAASKGLGKGSSTSSVETNIGEVKVYSQATDAQGVARDIGQSLDYLFTTQSTAGLF